MNKGLLKKFIRPFIGKKYQQAFYEKLHLISLVGMNYGIGGDLKVSGELNALKYIKKTLQGSNHLVMFDIGANVGDYTKGILETFNTSDIKIYSFEPSVKTFSILKSNINSPNVNLINLGMSDKPENLSLYSGGEDSGLTSVYKRDLDHKKINLDNTEEIELTTVDLFCKDKGIDTIHFMKMDVEGHEYKVLKGASNMIKDNKIKFIQFEFGGCNIDSRTFFKDFYNLLKGQYDIYRIIGDGLRLIKGYDEMNLEIYTTINFLAKLRAL